MVGFVLRCIVRTLKYDPNVIETIIFNGSYAFVIVCGCIIIGIACRYPMFGRLSIAGLYRAAKLCLGAKRRVNISPLVDELFFQSAYIHSKIIRANVKQIMLEYDTCTIFPIHPPAFSAAAFIAVTYFRAT